MFRIPEADLNEIPAKVGSFEPWLSDSLPDEDILKKINISGNVPFQKKIVVLCKKYKHLFSDTLPKQAAKLTPFNLVVDETRWQVPAHRQPPRRMSPERQIVP